MTDTGVVEVLDLSLRRVRRILVAHRKKCHCEERKWRGKLKGDEIFAMSRTEESPITP